MADLTTVKMVEVTEDVDKAKEYATAAKKAAENAAAFFDLDTSGMSAVERQISIDFIKGRTGKVFGTKIYRFKSNTTSSGERLKDSVGLTCTPSTNSVQGTDDFATASPIFTWKNCNYVRDDDSTARPTALEGSANYKTTGNVDVGIVSPTFWWTRESHDTYDIIYMSDTPHDELGLVPFGEAVTSDGKVLPYYCLSKYMSVKGTDGLPHSIPGFAPGTMSFNDAITEYGKKGKGYHGAGVARILHGWLMLIIKYATKNTQKVFQACSRFDTEWQCAVAESNVKRVLVSKTSVPYAGCCVSVGTRATAGTKMDRSATQTHSVCDRVKVKSIEDVTVSGTTYTALNLDINAAISPTTSNYVITMPCYTGETDAVIGHNDGSYLSNTDGHHSFRIGGIEHGVGMNELALDEIYYKSGNKEWTLYKAPKGTTLTKDSMNGMEKIASFTTESTQPSGDGFIGDVDFYPAKQTYFISSVGTTGVGDSVGVGDYVWMALSVATGSKQEARTFGNLAFWPRAGFGATFFWLALSTRGWYSASAD